MESGQGTAAPAFTPERLGEIRALFGLDPVPGTLNVRVPDLKHAVEMLGEPVALTEHDTPIGPLRWWPVHIGWWNGGPIYGLVVRGQRTRTTYLELVADKSFRVAGLRDGDRVQFRRILRP